MSEQTREDTNMRIIRLFRDAMFHAIRGLNHVNDQAARLPVDVDTTDAVYHLDAAIGYLRQINEQQRFLH